MAFDLRLIMVLAGMQIIFNSSLPRSGSTLLQNVLAQNPAIYCSPTSGVFELLYAARQNFTSLDEFKLQDHDLMVKGWLGFCRGGVEGWYSSVTSRPVIVDKFRGAIYYYDWIQRFMPGAKVIVCIRDLRAILASMEKLHRRNSHLHDPAEDPAHANFVTVDQRVAHWMSAPPVGLAMRRLFDAFHKGHHTKFHFVLYENLMSDPGKEMAALYRYLELPLFAHNFDSVFQVVTENDDFHGVYGDHKIRPVLSAVKPDWNQVLGLQLSEAVVQNNRWFYEWFYPQAEFYPQAKFS